MPMDRNPLAEGYEARSKKANALLYVELRHPGVSDICYIPARARIPLT